MEDMHTDVKIVIKTINQQCQKSFEEHARRIDYHNMALKNIKVQMGQLSQAVKVKNSVSFQRVKKGSNSK